MSLEVSLVNFSSLMLRVRNSFLGNFNFELLSGSHNSDKMFIFHASRKIYSIKNMMIKIHLVIYGIIPRDADCTNDLKSFNLVKELI